MKVERVCTVLLVVVNVVVAWPSLVRVWEQGRQHYEDKSVEPEPQEHPLFWEMWRDIANDIRGT